IHFEALNELFTTHIEINKQGEKMIIEKNNYSLKPSPLNGVVFGIYQNFNYSYNKSVISSKNTCVGYLVTDESGKASLDLKIPEGEYYLKELKTNSNYDLDTRKYVFQVTATSNKNYTVQLDNNNCFFNKLSKSSVRINKSDADTNKPLRNVEFTLCNQDNEILGVYKTNRKGIIQVDNLPYGKYYFIETKCRNGYYSTNNKYHFTLNSSDEVILNITNQPILKLGFNERYKVGLMITCSILLSYLFIVLSLKKKHIKGLHHEKK
ncbi:MAG: prealbumin-like fold domain-containing protein, partial [Oscillospiraceae bacterium]|nr:prealbumin-like fold domain-containing protein [Oscillospiraceae bacterium]